MGVTLWAFGLGLLTGWLLIPMPGQRRRQRLSGPTVGETLDESLARLSTGHRPGVRMKGGQVLMGPNQPRPQVQSRVPDAPPRGFPRNSGFAPGAQPRVRPGDSPGRPAGMPTTGTTGGAGQARAT